MIHCWNREQSAAFVFGMAAGAQIEMEAMKAANVERVSKGLSPAYGEDDFYKLIESYGVHWNNIVETLNIGAENG